MRIDRVSQRGLEIHNEISDGLMNDEGRYMIMAKLSMPRIKDLGLTRDSIPLSPSGISHMDLTWVHQRANGVMVIGEMNGVEEERVRKMRSVIPMMILK